MFVGVDRSVPGIQLRFRRPAPLRCGWARSVGPLRRGSRSTAGWNRNPTPARSDFATVRLPTSDVPEFGSEDSQRARRKMDERSTADVGFGDNDDDDDVRGQIEGYNSPSSSQGTSSKSRHQRKDGDDQLDEDDFERILSRSTARRLLALFEGNSPLRWQKRKQRSATAEM